MSDNGKVEIPFTELTLTQAAGFASDGDTFWVETMPAILARFARAGITYESYWQLTVHEHAVLAEAVSGGS